MLQPPQKAAHSLTSLQRHWALVSKSTKWLDVEFLSQEASVPADGLRSQISTPLALTLETSAFLCLACVILENTRCNQIKPCSSVAGQGPAQLTGAVGWEGLWRISRGCPGMANRELTSTGSSLQARHCRHSCDNFLPNLERRKDTFFQALILL